jgi:molybdopterin-guanine dinucleotide biosynthesis protein A
MTGIVLCGGKSSRMGSDKGLLQYEFLTWAELAAIKFTALQLPFVLSVNDQQYQTYSEQFSQFSFIKDNPSLHVNGPLQGILSVHMEQPDEDLFVLACDMPSMEIEPLAYLLNLSLQKSEEAFAFQEGSHVEPVCAIYTTKGLRKIYNQYKQGQLMKDNLHYVLDNVNTFYDPVPEKWKEYFHNYNSPDDLKIL